MMIPHEYALALSSALDFDFWDYYRSSTVHCWEAISLAPLSSPPASAWEV
jgi:hypothetical protein